MRSAQLWPQESMYSVVTIGSPFGPLAMQTDDLEYARDVLARFFARGAKRGAIVYLGRRVVR